MRYFGDLIFVNKIIMALEWLKICYHSNGNLFSIYAARYNFHNLFCRNQAS